MLNVVLLKLALATVVTIFSGFGNPESLIYLWSLLLCWFKAFLEEKVFSQKSHGIHIPSRWLASMCCFIKVMLPSFPHTLQIRDVSSLGIPFLFPTGIIIWPFSIIDLTFSSSACRSVLDWFGSATVLEAVEFIRGFMSDCWVVGFCSICFFSSTKSLMVCPVRPFSWISSAMARKESKSSSQIFASPK